MVKNTRKFTEKMGYPWISHTTKLGWYNPPYTIPTSTSLGASDGAAPEASGARHTHYASKCCSSLNILIYTDILYIYHISIYRIYNVMFFRMWFLLRIWAHALLCLGSPSYRFRSTWIKHGVSTCFNRCLRMVSLVTNKLLPDFGDPKLINLLERSVIFLVTRKGMSDE